MTVRKSSLRKHTHLCAKEGAGPLNQGIMAQLRSSEVQQLLHNKFIVILGDSVQRTVYKDLVLLLQKDRLLTYRQLRARGELSFEQDKLVDGGQKVALHNGTNYREVREFCTGHHLVRFYFLTRVYSVYVQDVLEELQSHKHTPDVLIINSCLWDISRYEQDSFSSYRKNLENLFMHLGQVLPKSCLLVWNTAMPVDKKITGSFLLPEQLSSQALALRKMVIEANFYSYVEAKKHNLDVLDLHFHFRHVEGHRQDDGVHWNERAHRRISELLLAHVADAWGVELPRRQSIGQWIKVNPARGRPSQGVERQSQTSRYPRALPLPPPLPCPRHSALLPLPAHGVPQPPLLPPPLPIPCHPPVPPQFLFCPQDTYFSSDQPFQSGQFFLNYFHSDVPSSTQTEFYSETEFMFDPQPPRAPFPTPYYQRRAPVVHRGFPRNLSRGRYVPWRQPPKSCRRQAPAYPEPRPH